MKRSGVISLLCIFGLLFYGCGGGGGSSSSSGGENSQVKTTPITSREQAKNVAAASVSFFGDLVKGSSSVEYHPLKSLMTSSKTYKSPSTLSEIASTALSAVKKVSSNVDMLSTRSTVNETENCTYGGTITYSGSYNNSTGYMDIKVQMDKCNDDNEYVDSGVFYIKGSYTDDNNFDLRVSVDSFISNAVDGSDNTTDRNFIITLKSENGKENDVLIAKNGFVSDKWVYKGDNYSDKVTFYNFKLTDNDTNTGEEFTANGIVTYDLNPESACEGLSGTYKYETITPVEYDESSDLLISGDVKINDNTEIRWTGDGTAHIYYNDTEVYQGSENDLSNVCPALSD